MPTVVPALLALLRGLDVNFRLLFGFDVVAVSHGDAAAAAAARVELPVPLVDSIAVPAPRPGAPASRPGAADARAARARSRALDTLYADHGCRVEVCAAALQAVNSIMLIMRSAEAAAISRLHVCREPISACGGLHMMTANLPLHKVTHFHTACNAARALVCFVSVCLSFRNLY